MTDIDLVVFDLGGVIVRAARSFEEAWAMAGRDALGQPAPGLVGAHLAVVTEYMTGRATTDEYVAAIAEAAGGLFSHEESRRILDAWVADEYPGVGGVLDAIEAAGIATAVLSNTNTAHWELIEAEPARYANILRHASIFTSHTLGLAKPDSAAYGAVEQATGVEGGRILFFDDVLANVEAARAAGWHAEHVDHLQPSTAPQLLGYLRAHRILPG